MKTVFSHHTRVIGLLALLLATMLVSLPAIARPGHCHGDMGPGKMGPHGIDNSPEHREHMATELGLTSQQRTDFERITTAAREQSRPLFRQMRDSHKAMEALIEGPAFDAAAVRAQAQTSTALMAEMAVIHARSRFDLRQLLTPEQREKMQAMHRKHGHHGRHQDGHEGEPKPE